MEVERLKVCIEEVQSFLREGTLEERLAQFKENHGIRSKTDGNLLILDYDQIRVKWSEPYGYVCRGLILDASTLDVVAFGLPKFFNFGESYADELNWQSAMVYEKLDGSMVQRFFNPRTKEFEFSTRFQLPCDLKKNIVSDLSDYCWHDLISRCFNTLAGIEQSEDETLVFEAMSPLNRVVVNHSDFKARVIAIRDNITFKEKSLTSLDESITPPMFPLFGPEACQKIADKYNGDVLEGFVVCDENFNRVKIKSKNYINLHRMKDKALSLNSIILLIKEKDEEEVLVHYPEFNDLFGRVKSHISSLAEKHNRVYEEYKGIENQKEFALSINEKKLEMPSVLFQTRAGKFPSVESAIFGMSDSSFVKLIKSTLPSDIKLTNSEQ